MKSKLMKGLVIVALAGSLTACEMDRQQRHTATGAAIGGVAGGLLGGDIATTLGGAALGGVIGSQVNKGGDYDDREYLHHKYSAVHSSYSCPEIFPCVQISFHVPLLVAVFPLPLK